MIAALLKCTALPSQVLFFARLFADVTGRVAPRVRVLAPQSPLLLAALGVGMVATLPGYFLYIRAGPAWHSDAIAVGARLSRNGSPVRMLALHVQDTSCRAV